MEWVVELSENIEAMSKLRYKYADKNLFDEDFGEFIYFSSVLDSHGPRVKFYGGSSKTNTTRTAPSLSFGVDGVQKVIVQNWMNKDNCPNVYDKSFLDPLIRMVNNIRPILLLVWFLKLDESDALHYFEGSCTFEDLMKDVDAGDAVVNKEICKCKNMNDLHTVCKKNNLYSF